MPMSMTCSYGTTRGGLALIHGTVLLAGIAVRRACYGIDMVGGSRERTVRSGKKVRIPPCRD
jgi:hypothetical protein